MTKIFPVDMDQPFRFPDAAPAPSAPDDFTPAAVSALKALIDSGWRVTFTARMPRGVPETEWSAFRQYPTDPGVGFAAEVVARTLAELAEKAAARG